MVQRRPCRSAAWWKLQVQTLVIQPMLDDDAVPMDVIVPGYGALANDLTSNTFGTNHE